MHIVERRWCVWHGRHGLFSPPLYYGKNSPHLNLNWAVSFIRNTFPKHFRARWWEMISNRAKGEAERIKEIKEEDGRGRGTVDGDETELEECLSAEEKWERKGALSRALTSLIPSRGRIFPHSLRWCMSGFFLITPIFSALCISIQSYFFTCTHNKHGRHLPPLRTCNICTITCIRITELFFFLTS